MKEKKHSTLTLGRHLALVRKALGMSLRDVQKNTKIGNSTLCRIEQGKPVDYDTGKRLEEWLNDRGIPETCDHCAGVGVTWRQK